MSKLIESQKVQEVFNRLSAQAYDASDKVSDAWSAWFDNKVAINLDCDEEYQDLIATGIELGMSCANQGLDVFIVTDDTTFYFLPGRTEAGLIQELEEVERAAKMTDQARVGL